MPAKNSLKQFRLRSTRSGTSTKGIQLSVEPLQCDPCTSDIPCQYTPTTRQIKYSFRCRYSERNDTYIFVPEGEAQSLTIHRSSGDIVLNCESLAICEGIYTY